MYNLLAIKKKKENKESGTWFLFFGDLFIASVTCWLILKLITRTPFLITIIITYKKNYMQTAGETDSGSGTCPPIFSSSFLFARD